MPRVPEGNRLYRKSTLAGVPRVPAGVDSFRLSAAGRSSKSSLSSGSIADANRVAAVLAEDALSYIYHTSAVYETVSTDKYEVKKTATTVDKSEDIEAVVYADVPQGVLTAEEEFEKSVVTKDDDDDDEEEVNDEYSTIGGITRPPTSGPSEY